MKFSKLFILIPLIIEPAKYGRKERRRNQLLRRKRSMNRWIHPITLSKPLQIQDPHYLVRREGPKKSDIASRVVLNYSAYKVFSIPFLSIFGTLILCV